MAFLESCSEKAASLAGGLVWLAGFGGQEPEPVVMAAVAGVGLAALAREAFKRSGPENPRQLKKIQDHVRASIADWQRQEGVAEADLAAAEAALDRSLGTCFIDRQRLADSAVSGDGFPRRATELVLEHLALREPIFREALPGDIARRFAAQVVQAALEAAVQDEDYFRKLEPHLLLSMAQGIGKLQPLPHLVAETHQAVQQLVTRLEVPQHTAPSLASRHHLPRQLDRLVGRADPLARVAQRLGDACRAGDAPAALCVLEGMPGLGKSALALAIATQLAPGFPDFQFWFALGAHSGAALTSAEARDALLRRLAPGRDLPGTDDLRWQMLHAAYFDDGGAELRGVVVIDDCPSEQVVKDLMPPTAVPVIVTTRRAMALGWSEPLTELDTASARELVTAIDPALSSTAGLDDLLSVCPRLPLVLRTVAATLKKGRRGEAGLRRMVDEIRRAPLTAAGGSDTSGGVRSVLATSIAPLTGEQRAAWAALSVMTADFDTESAVAVAGCAVSVVDELVERYLLEVDPPTGRCRWHDLMRALAAEQVDDEARAQACSRHGRHFTTLVHQVAAPLMTGQGDLAAARQVLDREWPHIAAALSRASAPGAAVEELRALVMGVTPFQLRYRLGWPELEIFWQQALRTFEAKGDAPVVTRCRWGLGDAALMQDFYAQAADHFRAAIECVDDTAEPVVAAWLHYSLADVLRQSTDEVSAPRQAARRAQVLFEAAGHRKGMAECSQLIGHIEYEADESPDGEPHLSQALAQYERQQDGAGVSSVLAVQGRILHEMGRHAQAIALSRRALDLATQHGDLVAELNALTTLGLALTQIGELTEATLLLDRCESRARRHGNRAALAWASYGQALLAIAGDRLEDARSLLEDLRPLASEISDSWSDEVLMVLAEVLTELGRAQEAWALCADLAPESPQARERVRLVRAIACLEARDTEAARPEIALLASSTLGAANRMAVANAVYRLARIDADLGHGAIALEGLGQALALYRELGSVRGQVSALWHCAALLQLQQRPEEARQTLETMRRIARTSDLLVEVGNAQIALARLDVRSGAPVRADQGFTEAGDTFLAAARPDFAVLALLEQGDAAWVAEQAGKAFGLYRRARWLARHHQLPAGQAAALERSATLCTVSRRWGKVVPLLRAACVRWAEAPDHHAECLALARLVDAAGDEGDWATAERAAEKLLALRKQDGTAEDQCLALLRLARTVGTADRVRSEQLLDEAADLAEKEGMGEVTALALEIRAAMDHQTGQYARALDLIGQARRHLKDDASLEHAWLTVTEIEGLLFQGAVQAVSSRADAIIRAAASGQDHRLLACGHAAKAQVAAWEGSHLQQAHHAERVLALRQHHGPRRGLPWGHLLHIHAQVHLHPPTAPATDDLAAGLEHALEMARRFDTWGAEVSALIGLSCVDTRRGDHEAARQRLEASLAIARHWQDPAYEIEILFKLGRTAQAQSLQQRLGYSRNPLFEWAL